MRLSSSVKEETSTNASRPTSSATASLSRSCQTDFSNDQDTLGCQGSFRFGQSLAQVTDPDGLLNRSD
jgi:hypothetical protein